MDHTALELTLRAVGDGKLAADLRLRPPGSPTDADLASGVPVTLDTQRLLELSLDPDAYGRALTDQLFACATLREAWATVRGYIQGANTALRLRLRIDPGAEALHALRWELLQDPSTQAFLCQSERVLFARYLDTGDLATLVTPALADVRALVAVANPRDLEEFNLDPVDVAGEMARTRQALGDLPITPLAGEPHGPRATLSAIVDGLRAGHSLLYLVCHGTLLRGEPRLWLETDDGAADRVPAENLVARIADLPPERRPLLVVLASCQSAGRDDAGPVLAALGPRLARAGVGAVIGMQGNVPTPLVERLMPRLFALLRAEGQIDRALAIARADMPPGAPWWLPVLYMRVRDGRLWAPAGPAPEPAVPRVAEGLDALLQLLRSPAVRERAVAFHSDFAAARAQVGDVIALKDVHDLLHTLQFQCFIPLSREARGFPDDAIAVENIYDYGLTLRTRTAEIRTAFARSPAALGSGDWVNGLDTASLTLDQALSTRDAQVLGRAIWEINRVLALQPSFINANLVSRARALRLQSLVEAMEALRGQIAGVVRDKARLASFEAGVVALADLHRDLSLRIAEHDTWQTIDGDVRLTVESLRHGTGDLELAWPGLRPRLLALAAGEETWANSLRAESDQLDVSLAGAGHPAGAVFQRCARLIGERFFQVDVDLKRLCSQLRELGDPLSELERTLS